MNTSLLEYVRSLGVPLNTYSKLNRLLISLFLLWSAVVPRTTSGSLLLLPLGRFGLELTQTLLSLNYRLGQLGS